MEPLVDFVERQASARIGGVQEAPECIVVRTVAHVAEAVAELSYAPAARQRCPERQLQSSDSPPTEKSFFETVCLKFVLHAVQLSKRGFPDVEVVGQQVAAQQGPHSKAAA